MGTWPLIVLEKSLGMLKHYRDDWEIFVSFPQTCNEYILLFTDQFLLLFVIPSVFILFRIGKDTSLVEKTFGGC